MLKAFILTLAAFGIVGCGTPPVPNMSFESLETKGKLVHMDDLRGKVVLLDFWATWCGPCKESKPFIVELHEKFSPKGLYVVGLTNETRATVTAFEKGEKQSYPIFLDTDNSVNITLEVERYPTVIILGKSGEILFRGHPGEKEEIVQVLEQNL
jgi:thiol-disulfide isomerase/thioredoxin